MSCVVIPRSGRRQISIVDHDKVELSNLHRQVLHSEFTLGMNKAESARIVLLAGNRSAHIDAYPMPFAMDRLSKPTTGLPPDSGNDYLPELGRFSLVLDCTDNPTSRYLISDACAAFGIPLVSGAAIRSQGQLSVWNLPSSPSSLPGTRGPCYRCIFPETEQIRFERCADEGVLGPTVGLVGVLMAWEAIRLLLGTHDLKPSLLLVPSFRRIKLRNANGDCVGCGSEGRAAFLERLRTAPVDRVSNGDDNLNDATFLKACLSSSKQSVSGNSTQRITADDLVLNKHQLDRFWVLDVRPPTQFGICALPNSINIPITEILENPELMVQRLREIEDEMTEHDRPQTSPNRKGWLIVCRRGNDSLLAAEALNGVLFSDPCSNVDRKEGLVPRQDRLNFIDFDGGLEAYSLRVDSTFPIY